MSVIADVVMYVLKNGPRSLSQRRGLTVKTGSHSESNMHAELKFQVRRIWVRGVVGVRPEAGRSRRGQVEA